MSVSLKQYNYLQQLDSVRGILSIIVFMTHLKAYMSIYLAYTAMHVFFILSTFFVCKTFLSDLKKNNQLEYSAKLFWLKRLGRIVPVYFFYLFILIIFNYLILLANGESKTFINEFKQYGWMFFSFTYNLREWFQFFTTQKFELIDVTTPHLWSISFEIQLYALMFVLIYFFNKKTLIKLAYFFIPFSIIFRILGYFVLQSYTSDQQLIVYLIQRNPLFHLDLLFIGLIILFTKFENEKLFRYILILSFIVIISLFYFIPYYTGVKNNITFFDVLHQDKFLYHYHGIFYIDNIINIFTFSLIAYLINFPDKIKLLNSNLLIKLGQYSYVTYVFQMLFIGLGYLLVGILIILKISKISIVLFYILSAIAFSLSAFYSTKLIHLKFELPMMKWKDNMIKKYIKKNQQ